MKNDQKNNKFVNYFKEHQKPILIGAGFVLWFILLLIFAIVVRKYDSVAISIGNIEVAWYALFILSGILMAAILAYIEAPLVGLNKDDLLDTILFGVPIAIIGARLYYVLFNPVGGFKEIINIRQGGLAIHGAVILSIIFLFFFSRFKKMNIFSFLDIVAVGFLVGQIVGRWGNFFNQEAHGGPISAEAYNVLVKIIPNFIMQNMEINGVFYHPTFLYEGIWNFIGLVILLILRRKKVFKLGDMIGLYLIWYGLGRGLLIEPFRTDALKFIKDADPENFFLNMLNRTNVVLSLTLFTMGGFAYIFVKNKLIPDMPYYYDVVLENKQKIAKEQLKLEKKKNKKKK